MNFTIVTGAFQPVPPAAGGAVERRWHGIAKELVGRGHHVTMLGKQAPDLPEDGDVEGVRVIRHTSYSQTGKLPVDLLKDLLYALRIRGRVPPADVVISNDFFFPIVRRPSHKETFLVNVARVPKGQLRLYSHVHGILVPSVAMAESVLAEGVAPSRVTVLPNPIDTTVFNNSVARTYAPPWRLLFAGRIHPEKGISILIEAVRKLVADDVAIEARVIGPYLESQGGGGASYRQKLMEQAQGLPVDFIEPIFERSLLAEQYAWSHVFVYPSVAEKGESFGVAPVEAMSTGAIPVVSGLACFDDFMNDAAGERFDHRAPDPALELRDAILRSIRGDLVQKSGKLADLAKAFSYPTVADKLMAIVGHKQSG